MPAGASSQKRPAFFRLVSTLPRSSNFSVRFVASRVASRRCCRSLRDWRGNYVPSERGRETRLKSTTKVTPRHTGASLGGPYRPYGPRRPRDRTAYCMHAVVIVRAMGQDSSRLVPSCPLGCLLGNSKALLAVLQTDACRLREGVSCVGIFLC